MAAVAFVGRRPETFQRATVPVCLDSEIEASTRPLPWSARSIAQLPHRFELQLRSAVRSTGKRIDQGNAERLKIIDIASNYGQSANQSGSRDECVFKVLIRPSVHELRPTTKDGCIRGNNTVALRYAVKPTLYLLGLLHVPLPGNLYSSLYFTERHRGHVQ